MVEISSHPLVTAPPGGATWRRAERRRPAAGPEMHAELVVLLGLKGEARYLLDGAVHGLAPGVLLWALAGQRHVLLDESADFDQRVLLISRRMLPGGEGEALPPLALSERGALPPRRLGADQTGALEEIARQADALAEPGPRRTALRWWLMRAWAAWQAADTVEGGAVHPAVTRAAWILRDDPALTLPEVARRAGLSPGRLSKLFAAQTGGGLAAYRTDRRLDRAEAIHGIGRVTWLAAALEAGFGSYAQFYRAYRARHGAGPRGGAADR